MEEEIDLRPYLNVLWRNRLWLLGAAIAMATVAFLGSRLVPPRYETTALVVAVAKSDSLQFDPRITSDQDPQLIPTYPELAMSDAVILSLLNNLEFNDITLSQMQKLLTARTGSDNRIIQLIVELKDPVLAAEIANAWADELIDWTNLLYNTQASETLTFYENELATADLVLQQTEESLIEYEGINQTAVFSYTLQALYQTQADTLVRLNEINQTAEDIAHLQNFLNESTTFDTPSFSDQLTLLNLQTQTFNATNNPIFLQVSPEADLSAESAINQIDRLDRLAEITSAQAASAEQMLADLEPEILATQQELQTGLAEYQRLARNHLVAEENYLTLARKVSEERILAQDSTPILRLISEAPVPDEPINQNTLVTVAVATVLGLSLGAAILLFLHWWRATEM